MLPNISTQLIPSPSPPCSIATRPSQHCLYYHHDKTSPFAVIRPKQLPVQSTDFTSLGEKAAQWRLQSWGVPGHEGSMSQWKSGPGHKLAVLSSMTEQMRAINSVEFNQHPQVSWKWSPEKTTEMKTEPENQQQTLTDSTSISYLESEDFWLHTFSTCTFRAAAEWQAHWHRLHTLCLIHSWPLPVAVLWRCY